MGPIIYKFIDERHIIYDKNKKANEKFESLSAHTRSIKNSSRTPCTVHTVNIQQLS